MNLTINNKLCQKNNILPEEAALAFLLKDTTVNAFITKMLDKNILVKEEQIVKISEEWKDKVCILCKDGIPENSEKHLEELAEKLRECYPSGKMPGTAYYYRCNKKDIVDKLKSFFAKYGQYSDEEILAACKRFVASYNGNTKFLPLLKFFILRERDIYGNKDGKSELASYLENKTDNQSNNDDWLTNSRNK